MASESTDTQDVAVSLPPELVEWLDAHATERDVDRDDLLTQLVRTYRRTAHGDTPDPAEPAVDRETLEEIVREVITDRREEIVADVREQLEDSDDVDTLAARLDDVEADFQAKLQDVRERVVQVKRETDAKAPADHHHDGLNRIDALEDRLDEVAGDVTALEAKVETLAAEATLEELARTVEDLEATVEDHHETLTDRGERLDDLADKLRTVGWAVSDLRETQRERGTDTLDRIKAAAASHDIDRAVCENCGDAVQIALMTRPACPHCDAAVTNVEPASGFFGKPALVTASQIESGNETAEPGQDVSASRSERR